MLVSFCMFFAVTLRSLRHKDHGQHTEHKRLNDADKQFEHHHHCRENGKSSEQSRHDGNQHDPCKHIPEQTEGKREDLGNLRDQLQQANQEIHRTEKRHLEHPASVEKFAQIASALRPETDHLDHHHSDQRECSRKVEVHGDTAKEGSKDVFIAELGIEKLPAVQFACMPTGVRV